jgi:hypothetical protein
MLKTRILTLSNEEQKAVLMPFIFLIELATKIV